MVIVTITNRWENNQNFFRNGEEQNGNGTGTVQEWKNYCKQMKIGFGIVFGFIRYKDLQYISASCKKHNPQK